MSSAAERFYTASHHTNERMGGPRPQRSVAEVLKEVSSAQHRYYCVYAHLKAHPDLAVVELGFGSADIAAGLASLAQSYRIVDVVDRRGDFDMPPNAPFTKADLNVDFPFRDGEFDCTVAMMVIEHLFDPFHSFSEVARITRPGGKVLVNLPNIGSFKCRLQLLAGRMPVTSSPNWYEKNEWDGNHLHYFTISDTVRLAAKYGLKLDAIHTVGRQPWLKQLRPSLFCHEISFAFSRP